MLLSDPNFSPNFYYVHSRLPSDWYESFSHFTPTPEFLRVTREMLPLSWHLWTAGVWTHVSPPESHSVKQGWKIHVNAKPDDTKKILEKCTQICTHHEVPFKFLTDPLVFAMVMSKGWSRESHGKFITIYPVDVDHFQKVADDLSEALTGYESSYILSDKPYKGSKVVYYRYGAFWGYPQLSVWGTEEVLLSSPEGDLVTDGRSPFFNEPSWVSDPFDAADADEEIENTHYLKDGQYRVEDALHFSLTGGVYKAVDLDTGKTVIIKEARPHTSIESNGNDAIDRLKKEYRLLQRLSGTGIAPEPLDLFQDWEHYFLVEEFLPGENLLTRISGVDIEALDSRTQAEAIYVIWSNLTYAVKIAHDRNIIINDFSPGNVIISVDNETLRLIDLEGGWEEGVDDPSSVFGTEGYRSPNGVNSAADDIYGIGMMIFSLVYPVNTFIDLQPKAKQIFLSAAEESGRLPSSMKNLLLECIDDDEKNRPSAEALLNRLDRMSIGPCNVSNTSSSLNPSDAVLSEKLNRTVDYIKSTMCLERKDRLFPADPTVFVTNPLSVAHGASGIAYAFKYLGDESIDAVISWMLSHDISTEKYPPGLYIGLSGIAWVFWTLGLRKLALKLMKMASNHPLLWDESDIYYGAAGYGLACLYFHKETQDAHWLEQAIQVGDRLIKRKTEVDEGAYWPDTFGNVWCSYARGSAGIALFLLYLYLSSREIRFKHAGRSALAYDLAQVQEFDEKLKIPRAATNSQPRIDQNVFPPYWSDGTAGVCTALVRYFAAFGEDEDQHMLERLMPDTFQEHTAFPTLFTGLAGLGNTQLDVSHFTGDTRYVSEAIEMAERILRFQIEKPDGIAFPGEQLSRISTDFGSGSAGIALFLHRLINREKDLPNFNFLLDELLCQQK